MTGGAQRGSTKVWKGRSNRSPGKLHTHTQPGGLGNASKYRFPPGYESPRGPWKTPQLPPDFKTIANRSPAETETGAEKTRPLKLGGDGKKGGRPAPGMVWDVSTTPFGAPPATPCISTTRLDPGSQATGNLTSVRNPDAPAVTICASFCALLPPMASPPTLVSMIGCCWSITGVAWAWLIVPRTAIRAACPIGRRPRSVITHLLAKNPPLLLRPPLLSSLVP
jgi:hypothetical protein